MDTKTRVITLGIFISAIITGGVTYLLNEKQAAQLRKTPRIYDLGDTVPDLEIKRLQGGPTRLSELAKDNNLLFVNFWATWCATCEDEVPSLIAMEDEFKEQGVAVLLVSVDKNPRKVVPGFVKRHTIDFPVYADGKHKLVSHFFVHSIPFSVILDADLKVVHIESAGRYWDTAESRMIIQNLLKESEAGRRPTRTEL